MKQNYLKSLLVMLMMCVGMGAWAETIIFDFEDEGAHQTGTNSYTGTNNYVENSVDMSLKYADAIQNSGISGSYFAQGRIAKNTTNSPVILIGPIDIAGKTVTEISYKQKGNTNISQVLEYSLNNSSWTTGISTFNSTSTATQKSTSTLSITGTSLYVKITGSVASSTNSARDFQVDDITITYTANGGSGDGGDTPGGDPEPGGDGDATIVCKDIVWAASGEQSTAALSATSGNYTVNIVKNNGSTAPAYNSTGLDVRAYAKATVTISSETKQFTSVVFNISTQGLKRLAPITASSGTIATQASGDKTVTWTSSTPVSSVTFTVGDNANYGSDGSSKAGQLDFTSIDITEAAPTFDSLEELIDANLEEPTVVNVTIDNTVLQAMNMGESNIVYIDCNGEYIVLAAPGSDLGWEMGGTVSGTLENVTWDPEEYTLTSETDFWSSLDYTAPAGGETETITINPACTDGDFFYTTYSSMNAFYVPNDLYVCEVRANNGEIELEPYTSGDIVPAYTGVLIGAEAGGDYKVTIEKDPDMLSIAESVLGDANALRPTCTYGGVTAEDMEWDDPDCKFYRLTMHKGATIGFWWGAENGAGFDLGNNKAYLAMPNSSSSPIKAQGLWFNMETAIKNVADQKAENGMIFNLQGQRVNAAQKGIYIMNGKKVVK